MAAVPPSEDDLAKKAAGLKASAAKEKAAPEFDEATYKAAWENSGKDGAKAAATLGLTETPKDYDAYIKLCKDGKFKD